MQTWSREFASTPRDKFRSSTHRWTTISSHSREGKARAKGKVQKAERRIFKILTTVNKSAVEMLSPTADCDELWERFDAAVAEAANIRTDPGTTAFRAKMAVLRQCFLLYRCNDGDLVRQGGEVGHPPRRRCAIDVDLRGHVWPSIDASARAAKIVFSRWSFAGSVANFWGGQVVVGKSRLVYAASE